MAGQVSQAVARRYAKALFELAQEQNVVDQVERELDLVLQTLAASKELRLAWEMRTISSDIKHDLIKKTFGGKIGDLTLNFISVLVRKRRENILAAVKKEFVALANQARGILEVEVRSAVPLEASTVTALQTNLGARLGKQIQMTTLVQPELIGGLVVRVGDQLLDGSVKTRLQRIKERLVAAQAQ